MGNLPWIGPSPLEEPGADPWTVLTKIRGYLERGEVVPRQLAWWLADAIRYGNGDTSELLLRLSLKRKRGRVHHKHAKDAAFRWGQRVFELERIGLRTEEAVGQACDEYSGVHPSGVGRTQMRTWRDYYRTAKAEYDLACQDG